MSPRESTRFAAPWTIVEHAGSLAVTDAGGLVVLRHHVPVTSHPD